MKINNLQETADIIKSMAHPTRLLILTELAVNEKCVCELNRLVEIDQSTLSRHLSVLKNTGIITSYKKGQNVFYQLKYKCVLKYIQCLDNIPSTQ